MLRMIDSMKKVVKNSESKRIKVSSQMIRPCANQMTGLIILFIHKKQKHDWLSLPI
jgi:hypothetical protein